MINSIWTGGVELPVFPRLDDNVQTDVLVIGGGLAGILCAYQLTKAGVDCILIESDRICSGITRNTTAKLTSQHGLIYSKLLRTFGADTARAYWEANEAALQQFRTLAEAIPCDFESKNNYIYSTASVRKLEAEMIALQQLHIPAEFTNRTRLPIPIAGAIRFRQQAQFHPLKFAAGIVNELKIFEQTPARAFEKDTVLTDHGRIKAEKIIIATHFPILNKHGAYFLKLYQDRSYVMALTGADNLDGMYLDESKSGFSFRNAGDLLLLGGGGHRTGRKSPGWTALSDFAKTHYPTAAEKCRWAAQDCMSLDGLPYIGPYSKNTPNLYVATGFNKWGMTQSMAAAAILTDLVQGKEHPSAALFSPSRSTLRPQLFINALESAVNLLTPTKPRCPHMGCALKWNPQEHSWDCPCHGSRFTESGILLDDPATGNMKNSRS